MEDLSCEALIPLPRPDIPRLKEGDISSTKIPPKSGKAGRSRRIKEISPESGKADRSRRVKKIPPKSCKSVPRSLYRPEPIVVISRSDDLPARYCQGPPGWVRGMPLPPPRPSYNFMAPEVLEVLSIRINNKDHKPRGLYGTVVIGDGFRSQYLYNRKREDSDSIKPAEDNFLLLTPATYISLNCTVCIEVTLIDKDTDNVVSYGFVSCDPITFEFDKSYSLQVNPGRFIKYVKCDKYGPVTVDFLMLSNAVVANVEATLLTSTATNVHGRITAINVEFMNCESVLLQKNLEEKIEVGPGQLIPLSKSVVPVNFGSSLRISALLYDDCGRSLFIGTAEFDAQVPAERGVVSEGGIFGRVGVKVTWVSYI